jgi:hypothetical protein
MKKTMRFGLFLSAFFPITGIQAAPMHGGFNIDFGTLAGTPVDIEPGASGLRGVWNTITSNAQNQLEIRTLVDGTDPKGAWTVQSALSDTNGNASTGTTISITIEGGANPSWGGNTGFDNVRNDDFHTPAGMTGWEVEITGLTGINGIFDVYVYTLANDFVESGDFSVNGDLRSSLEGNLDGNSYVHGQDYWGFNNVNLSGGLLEIRATNLTPAGSSGADLYGIAGIQLVQDPYNQYAVAPSTDAPIPASLSLLGLGLIVLRVTRRQ